jgi:hypothetical protein
VVKEKAKAGRSWSAFDDQESATFAAKNTVEDSTTPGEGRR